MNQHLKSLLINIAKENFIAENFIKNSKLFDSESAEDEKAFKELLLEKTERNTDSQRNDIIVSDPYKDDSLNVDKVLDMRITEVTIKNFRGIKCKNNKNVGIITSEIIEKNIRRPFSLVLLGNNGKGKTSLFTAIELLTYGNSSIGEKNFKKSTDQDFYNNFENKANGFQIRLDFIGKSETRLDSKDSNYFKIITTIQEEFDNLRTFFSSDSNITMFEYLNKETQFYFDDLIGLKDLRKAKKILEEVFEDLTNNNNSESRDSNNQDLKKFINLIDDLNAENTLNNAVLPIIKKKISEISSGILIDSQEIIESLMNGFEDEVVMLSYDPTIENYKRFDGKLQLRSDHNFKIEPKVYYNNFRLKLYLVSLRIAIAFSYMKTMKINFPLVFDDVFFSSDFNNRRNIKKFFGEILRKFKDLKISEKPLQIIFFTQDEIIANEVYGVLKQHEESLSKVKLGTLFLTNELESSDLVMKSSLNEESFYNLYDIIKE
ncbi:MAG: hypothetical protein J1E16_11800 [Muribaculaceae bacterium]|nr:hypothetical protein [Muribaculaceae bacterium]